MVTNQQIIKNRSIKGTSYFLARISLGTLFILAGLDGFLQLLPQRAFTAEGEMVLRTVRSVEPFWISLNSVQIIAGSILLFGLFDVLAIFILAPIVIGIVVFHAAYDFPGIPFSLFLLVLFLVLIWNMREDPRSLLRLNFDDGIKKIWRNRRRSEPKLNDPYDSEKRDLGKDP